jgi:quinol monooxygenase YgiN
MIVIAGSVTVRAERRDEAVQIALRMAAASRAEAGCVEYRFYADLADPNTFFLFEHWENEAALARHFQTPHMAEFQEQLPGLLVGASKVRRYVVSDVTGM